MRSAPLVGLEALRRDANVRTVAESAAACGMGPLYLVGGYLRDLLLGRAPGKRIDLDLVIWGEMETFGRAVALALGGTLLPVDREAVRVLGRLGGVPVRVDVGGPKGDTIEADLAVRDFTVNALAVRIDRLSREAVMEIIDPWGGRSDLTRKCLRVLAPSAFDRDPLRLIRAVRLAGELDFTIEDVTCRAIVERASLLATVAGERLRDELFRIIDTVPAATSVERLNRLHLLRALIPEVEGFKEVPASPPHRLPLWEHSMETLRSVELMMANLSQVFPEEAPWLAERLEREIEAGVTEAAVLKWLGFLHDVGKPVTRSVEPDGRVRFLGHEEVGWRILLRLCERIRLGKEATALVGRIERHHLWPLHLSCETTVTPRARYRFCRELGDAAPAVLLHSWADLRATIGAEAEGFARHQHFLREQFRFYRVEFQASQATPLVRGDDLIQALGLAPGPFLGRLLERLREAQATGVITSRVEGLAYARQHLDSWRQSYEARGAGLQND